MIINRNWKSCARLREQGFTLVEVVVGMVAVGVCLVALYGSLTSGFTTVRFARENMRATQVLTEKLEAIRLYRWEQITNNGYLPKSFKVPIDQANTNVNAASFTGTITVTNVPLNVTYSNDMRLVTLKLDWTTGGQPRTRQISTYVTKFGIQNYYY